MNTKQTAAQAIPCAHVGFLCGLLMLPIAVHAADRTESPSDSSEVAWFIKNVLSTSLATPGAAVKVPLGETVAVRGRILDVDGSPAEAAEVWAASVFPEPPLRERVWTDAEGYFELHLKPLRGKSDRWMLSAYKDNASVSIEDAQEWIDQPNPRQPERIVAKLTPGYRMTVRVLTQEDGTPISDVHMFLGDGRVLVSDEDGEITVTGLRQGSHPVVLLAEGRERRRVLFDNTLRPDGELELRLAKAGRIEGVVLDPDGNPIPHAWIKVHGSGRATTLDGRCAIANAMGEFIYEGVREGRVLRSLAAGAPGYAGTSHRLLTASIDQPTKLTFRLQRSTKGDTRSETKNTSPAPTKGAPTSDAETLGRRNLTGKIADQSGNPIENAVVRWGATMYEEVDREQRSDSGGAYRLNSVPDREGYVTVIADPYAPRFVKVDKGQTELDVRIRPGAKLGGRVVNFLGKPIAGVQVVPVIASPDPSLCNPYWIRERSTTTDTDGRFTIDGLPKLGVLIDFMHPRYTERRNQSLAAGKSDHEVKLFSRGAFRGRVTDTDGNPVRNFRITIAFPRERKPEDRLRGFSVVYRGIGNSYSDENGRFAWGGEVAPGSHYRVTAWADGFSNASIDRVFATTVEQLGESETHQFRLSPPLELTINVRNADTGDAIRDARVTVIDDDPRQDEAVFRWGSDEVGSRFFQTDASGAAKCKPLSFHQGTIAVEAAGFASKRLGWRQGERQLAVTLAPGAILTGTIKSSSGAALKSVSISVDGPDRTSKYKWLDETSVGQFKFDRLPDGKHTIVVRDERSELFRGEMTLEAGQTLELGFIVDPSSRKITTLKKRRYTTER